MSIPLTIDWLTLTWLKLRVSLWWRRQRLLVQVLALVGVATGCVPAAQFEEAQSAAQVEQGGRQLAEAQLAAQQAENAKLRAQLAQQLATLEQREQALAQAELDGSVQGKQRDEAAGMVEQLRGELARAAGHLQSFQDDKQKLTASLPAEAERGRSLARLTRDVSLLLATPITTGEYALDAEQGRLVLRVPRDKLLAQDGSLKPESATLLQAVARTLQLNPQCKLRLEDAAAAGDPLAVSRLVAALGEQAVAPERFEPLAVQPDEAGAA
ncbi:MAG TPA: hypothetical protein VIW29_12155, partial [Polyangiaceae bacterium]